MNRGSVYKRKDGRWEFRIYLGKNGNGRRIFRSFYGKTKEEVEFKATIFSETYNYNVTNLTVKDLIAEWMLSISAKVKESTAANYRMKAEKHIIPAFGDKQCCLIKSKDIYIFIENKLKSGLSVRYITDIIVMMKSIFKYASREYNIRNVLEGITLPKKDKSEVKIFDKDEQKVLERYIAKNQNLTTLSISISMCMGLRIGEICALKWSDIDLEKRILTVNHTIQRIQEKNGTKKTKLVLSVPKSASSKREIPIPECLIEMLKKFRNSGNIYVLSGKKTPIEPRTMQYRFSKILKNANLPSLNFHSLRHLFATNCIALGFDVKTLSEILGHSSIEVTLSRYVHSSMERKRACMDLMKTAV